MKIVKSFLVFTLVTLLAACVSSSKYGELGKDDFRVKSVHVTSTKPSHGEGLLRREVSGSQVSAAFKKAFESEFSKLTGSRSVKVEVEISFVDLPTAGAAFVYSGAPAYQGKVRITDTATNKTVAEFSHADSYLHPADAFIIGSGILNKREKQLRQLAETAAKDLRKLIQFGRKRR